jgi:uncharacterized protein YndB with AHSA1/START domain
MVTIEKAKISVSVKISSPVEKVWNYWTDPLHIVHWNNASDDWHTPRAENDLRVGGKFLSRMEARDGSYGFDFTGEYNKVEHLKEIEYTIADDRKVNISFVSLGNETIVEEMFEAEQTNPVEAQQKGWQSILENFKKYVEASGKFDPMHFEVAIDSKVEKVYKTMLDEKKYSEWTAEFNPTSHFRGSWEKGSKILFLGKDKDGKTRGMVSKIKENIPERFLSIEHLGIVQDEKEVLCGPEIDRWSGALENYTFTPLNGKTLLSVDIDSIHEFRSYFTEKWPKALNRLKSICEK